MKIKPLLRCLTLKTGARSGFIFCCTFLFVAANGQQQDTARVFGKVLNEDGKPVSNASVAVKGTNTGTQTDPNGNFLIAAAGGDSLVISAVNYLSRSVLTERGTELTVILKPDQQGQNLGEIVVVGYETRKKEQVVGAVTTVKPEDLRIPTSNLTTALAGKVAGVIAYQRTGEPGADNADFFVRGVTTFGYKNGPLILIDGIESSSTDLARLRVDDIASFSILKDATSTAVYGARGANGVILVNTKRGKVGKAKIELRAENSVSTATKNIELADPVTYMKMANEAVLTRDPLGKILYSDDKINRTGKEGSSPYIYPANDWRKLLFKDYANNQRYTLNVSGGGGVARYFVSGGLSEDHGVLRVDKLNNFNNNINLKSFSLRSNVDIDVTKTTMLTVRLYGNFDDYQGPIYSGNDMYGMMMHSNPVQFPATFPSDSAHAFVRHIMFGNNVTQGQQGSLYQNPYAEMVRGYRDWNRSNMMAQMEIRQNLGSWIKGLNLRGMFYVNRYSYTTVTRSYNPFYYEIASYDPVSQQYNINVINSSSNPNPVGPIGTEYLGFTADPDLREINSNFYGEAVLNYDNVFNGKHSVSGMLVGILQQRLNSAANSLLNSLPFRNSGLSGRFTYGYKSRYYGEFNFGYNGSERFHQSRRFGFFPSAGVAWTVHNEKFFDPLKEVITTLKLRYTYGLIGNDAIGSPSDRFFYLSEVNMNSDDRYAQFGRGDAGAVKGLNGVLITRYANEDITWEKSYQQNLGIELGVLRAATLNIDLFKQHRKNILMTRAYIPGTMGLSAPVRANVGEATSQGIDLSLNLSQSFNNGLFLSGMGNFTYATNKYAVFEEPFYKERYRSQVGQNINQQFGYIAERLFVDDEDARNAPNQNSAYPVRGGDIKYLDVNRDGQITDADRVPIGYPTVPEIVYGFGVSATYKNIDLSVFFQGLAHESFWIDYAALSPFVNETQVMKVIADDYWSEQHQNSYAFWPRLSNYINPNNNRPSTWFMRNGSFLRLKTAELGYTLPQHLTKKIHASAVRIYFSGNNLLTFSKFKLWDVEMGGNGLGYPIQKVYNIGLHIRFN
ncbi:SusC/RagA family TonB-linked outer membrane protein [Niabella beijingensis]|uniref:SusC/RagA family TonB-linked outer membrane protein n=1 Tax=Niabella beijingensis TaxID=2872700 RepID=UPI001CBB8070|nr:TonB-dependent receptor [Niabella beijingensis]MBZ4190523.1 TonB-dependent receptor [Niabella beijingensis]